MPTIARLHGIAVFLPTRDHNPPHFHASYAGQVVRIVGRASLARCRYV